MTSSNPHIVFAIYDGITQLDFTGPLQFLSRMPGAKTTIASLDGGNVHADCLTIADTAKLSTLDQCDILCVPGGWTTAKMAGDAGFISQIQRLSENAKYITSVCTGSLILGAAGLLEGKKATTHWAWRSALKHFGATYEPGRVVRDGNIITGGGVTAGIDFGLSLFAEIMGDFAAKTLQLGLEYDPEPPFSGGSPETSEQEVIAACNALTSASIQKNTELLKSAMNYRE